MSVNEIDKGDGLNKVTGFVQCNGQVLPDFLV